MNFHFWISNFIHCDCISAKLGFWFFVITSQKRIEAQKSPQSSCIFRTVVVLLEILAASRTCLKKSIHQEPLFWTAWKKGVRERFSPFLCSFWVFGSRSCRKKCKTFGPMWPWIEVKHDGLWRQSWRTRANTKHNRHSVTRKRIRERCQNSTPHQVNEQHTPKIAVVA